MTLLEPEWVALLLGATGDTQRLPPATGATFHSGLVEPGDIFFALPGAASHGLEHAAEALARGAAFIVTDRPHASALLVDDPAAALQSLGRFARERHSGPVIAITGSAGKTTTKELLAAALEARATPGNFNTPHALAETLIRSSLAGGTRPLVLELGVDHRGEMSQLAGLTTPDHAILTSIGASHLSGLGDLKGVTAEKSALLTATPGIRLVSEQAARHLPADLTVRVEVAQGSFTPAGDGRYAVNALGEQLDLPWPGRPVAENALLALTMAVRLGANPGAAAQRITGAKLQGGRLQRSRLGTLTLLDDSYNSNPLSLEAALNLLREAPPPRAAFLGDMLELGDTSEREHRRAGAATRGLELVVAVGPQSARMRDTNPAALLATDAQHACHYLERLPEGATVLIKGSRGVGMERVSNALRALAAAAPEGSE